MRRTGPDPGRRRRRRGLTLVEMVVALSVLSVIALLAVPMLNLPARSWHDATVRRDLAAELRLAQVRLDDELRHALPGSVRQRQIGSRHWLEFMLVRASARARDGLAPGARSVRPPARCPATTIASKQPASRHALRRSARG